MTMSTGRSGPVVTTPKVTRYENRKKTSEPANTAAPAHAMMRSPAGELVTDRYYRQHMSGNGRPGVVITGIGVVSPFGVGRERFWDHVRRGVSGCKAITQFDVSSYACQVAAWVPPVTIDDAVALEGENGHGRADPRRYSRAALFGVVA